MLFVITPSPVGLYSLYSMDFKISCRLSKYCKSSRA
jgi:hypothetical protein